MFLDKILDITRKLSNTNINTDRKIAINILQWHSLIEKLLSLAWNDGYSKKKKEALL
jgi:hypothetical protein